MHHLRSGNPKILQWISGMRIAAVSVRGASVLMAFLSLFNDHVTMAAATPMTTNELHSLGRVEAAIVGESGLVDRETGRVFWEGGSTNTLLESMMPKLDQYGFLYVKPAFLTCLVTLGAIGILGSLTRKVVEESLKALCDSTSVFSYIKCILLWIILWFPRIENKILVVASVILYLVEAFNCDTHRFLANAISSPQGVEDYIEKLREQEPQVSWQVQTYHYEQRKIFSPRTYLNFFRKFLRPHLSKHDESFDMPPATTAPIFLLTKKVVSNKASKSYKYKRCDDSTMAGMWKRARSTRTEHAPFTKITLTKLLVLSDRKSREDYFQQQSDFVAEHGRGDEYVEFSTGIEVSGFKRRMLAVRPVNGMVSTHLFQRDLFWFFTCLGLTIPYRIWFARRCDHLRVSVVKETSSVPPVEAASTRGWLSSWIPYGSSETTSQENQQRKEFQNFMKRLSLYPPSKQPDPEDEKALAEIDELTPMFEENAYSEE